MTVQEVVGVVDRSGSMRGKEDDTVGGINAAFDEIRKNKGEDDLIRVSLKLFDHEELMKWRCQDIDTVGEFPVSEFVPRGSTALLDAIGHTLTYFMEKKLREPEAYDTCLIYVVTDGLENASNNYTALQIKELIKNAADVYKITVVYLGANQDAILTAGNLGINANHAINYNENQTATRAVYRSVGRMATDCRHNRSDDVEFSNAERQASQTPS